MTMFRFRLQKVLDLKEAREREVASQLARAMVAEQAARARLDDLQAVREASATGPEESRSVGELANLAFVLECIDGHIATANEAVAAAGATVAQTQEALTIASQGRRMLDRLRERHAETHRAVSEQSDRKTMDDVALVRYTQGGAS